MGGDQPLPAPAVDLHPDVRHPERGGHRVGDRRELPRALVGRLEGGGEPGDDVVGVVAVAEHDPPDGEPEPLPQRGVEDGGEQQHQQHRLALVEGVAEEGRQPGQHREVDADDEDRQRAVEDGPREEDVDRDHVRSHDRDRHRRRRHHHQQERHQHLERGQLDERGQRDDEEHHQHRPEQPAHLAAVAAAAGAVARDDGRHREQEPEHAERAEHVGRDVDDPRGHRHAGRRQVDTGWDLRRAAGDHGRHDGGRADQQHQQQADPAHGPPPTGEEPPGGEEHEEHRGHDRQQRGEAQQEPQRERHARPRLVGGEAGADVRLGQPVEGPEQAEPGERPPEPVVRAGAQHQPREPGQHDAVGGVDPAGLRGDRGRPAGQRVAQVQHDGEREGGDREQREQPGADAVPPAHRDIMARDPGRRGPNRADRGGEVPAWRSRRAVGLVADHEADRGDQQPQRTGHARHVLQRRDAEQQRQPAEDQADPADPARHAAATVRREQRQPGEAGEGPEPRDGADPVVEHRRVGVLDGVLDRDAHHELGVEAAAHDRDERGADQPGERDGRQRRVGQDGPEPAVQTGGEDDQQHRAEGGEGVEGVHGRDLLHEPGRDAGGVADERGVVDRVHHAGGHDGADAADTGADAGDGPEPRAGATGGDGRAGRGVVVRSLRTGLWVVTWVLTVVPLSGLVGGPCRAGCPGPQGQRGTWGRDPGSAQGWRGRREA